MENWQERMKEYAREDDFVSENNFVEYLKKLKQQYNKEYYTIAYVDNGLIINKTPDEDGLQQYRELVKKSVNQNTIYRRLVLC